MPEEFTAVNTVISLFPGRNAPLLFKTVILCYDTFRR